MDSSYQYYQPQDILPTFADFRDDAALDAYELGRRRVFFEKLLVPPQMFRGADVLQFGPDTGEDSLVFARWGARMTLVEPNERAWPIIREYFRRYDLESSLVDLDGRSVLTFAPGRTFDFIDAEGFIYTVRPTGEWLTHFHSLLKPDGLFLVTYMETTGSFVEICTKALHRAGLALGDLGSVETANALFETKWNSIPHTRAFESWVMDVLDNPFVRRQYLIEAGELCIEAAKAGFELYSSWPSYRNSAEIYWHKRYLDYETLRARTAEHIKRSSLSFLTGHQLYFVDADLAQIEVLAVELDRVGEDADRVAGEYEASRCRLIAERLTAIRRSAAQLRTFSDPAEKEEALNLLSSLARAFEIAASEDFEEMRAFTNSDEAFIRNWGQPIHPVVFRRIAGKE